MKPAWSATLRRHWPVAGALAVFVVFVALHVLWFRTALARYQAAAQRISALGGGLELAGSPATMSSQLRAALSNNTLRAPVAEEQGNSGQLTAGMLEDLTRLAGKRGLEVVQTEQGPVTQLPGSVQVRAHLKLRGRYAEFVDLLGALGRSGTLFAVDRFKIESDTAGQQMIEMWVSQYILKQSGSRR
ncbi:MAG: hypothetical protein HZC42_05985 [Candidatus Eisenbacteria bacterium]|nr:hypothetical protein [Candidatus Eisenbacteria bacterium]